MRLDTLRLDTPLLVLWAVMATVAVPDARATDLSDFEWLVGTWKRESKSRYVYETWRVLSDRTMEGEAVLEGKSTPDKRLGEALLLVRMGDDIYYIPRPMENPYPVAFRLTSLDSGRAVFENPGHDFPQTIIYSRQQDGSMTVSIEGPAGDGPRRIDFHFTRVAASEINIDYLSQHWMHSREEEQQADESQIFRPIDFKEFPPSRFRMQYIFHRNGDCEWYYLAPNDAHRFRPGKWRIDPDDRALIQIDEGDRKSFYRVIELTTVILRITPITNLKEAD